MVKYNEGINDPSILEQQVQIVKDLAVRLEMETHRERFLNGLIGKQISINNPLSLALLLIHNDLKKELKKIKQKWKEENQ